MTTFAFILSVLVLGAAGGAGFGAVFVWRINQKIEERFNFWEAETDRIAAKEER